MPIDGHIKIKWQIRRKMFGNEQYASSFAYARRRCDSDVVVIFALISSKYI
jgi:hypothetical protein